MRTQRRRIRRARRPAHHIADQTLLPGRILARNHRRRRHPGMAQQNRLDLARLNAEPAQLHLCVRPTQKFQNPVRPPARHIPAAVHPAPRPTMRVRNKPLRRQPRTAQIPPRKPRTRDVKLPRNPRRNRLQASVQYIHPVIRQPGARSESFVRHRRVRNMPSRYRLQQLPTNHNKFTKRQSGHASMSC